MRAVGEVAHRQLDLGLAVHHDLVADHVHVLELQRHRRQGVAVRRGHGLQHQSVAVLQMNQGLTHRQAGRCARRRRRQGRPGALEQQVDRTRVGPLACLQRLRCGNADRQLLDAAAGLGDVAQRHAGQTLRGRQAPELLAALVQHGLVGGQHLEAQREDIGHAGGHELQQPHRGVEAHAQHDRVVLNAHIGVFQRLRLRRRAPRQQAQRQYHQGRRKHPAPPAPGTWRRPQSRSGHDAGHAAPEARPHRHGFTGIGRLRGLACI